MIVEVKTQKQAKDFIDLPRKLYKNDPSWVCTLDNEVEYIFDPSKNSFFHHGVCKRWLALNQKEVVIGRIAAFINYKKINGNDDPAGGIGFFECVDDKHT